MAPRESRHGAVPLQLSAASNGLQFSHHFNNYTEIYQPRSSQFYSDRTAVARFEGRPTKKQQTSVLAPVDANKRAVPRQAVSSLLPPIVSKPQKVKAQQNEQKAILTTIAQRRQSSAASIHSIHSTTSSFRSRKRKYYQNACLTSMPCEILDDIFKHLGQKELHAILLCNKYLADSAAPALYESPRFASTYRLAQFVTLITHNAPLAHLVRELDLSGIASSIPEDLSIAGWREWKYRTDPLHTLRKDEAPKLRRAQYKPVQSPVNSKSLHPLPSPFLSQYHFSRDVPLGSVMHIVVACPRLRKIDLSDVTLSPDYVVLPAAARYSGYKPTAFTGLLCVSDVPKAYTWRAEETRVLNSATDLVEAITCLKSLEKLKVQHGIWVTKDVALKLVNGCQKVEKMDFRGCGMYKGTEWAVKAPRDVIMALLDEAPKSDRRTPDAPDVAEHNL